MGNREEEGVNKGGGVIGAEINHGSVFCIMKCKNKEVKFKLQN